MRIIIADMNINWSGKNNLVLTSVVGSVLLASLTLACQGEREPVRTSEPIEPTPLPTLAPFPTSTPMPSATPASTPTAVPTATPTPARRETVTMYSSAHRTLDRAEYKDAERRFKTIVEIEPEFARAWAAHGQALYLQAEFDEAINSYDRAVSLRPNVGMIYGQRAMVRVATGDYNGAKRDALRALELDDEVVNAHLVLARVRANDGEYSEAETGFNRAISLAPDDGGVYWWRGRYFRDIRIDGQAAYDDFTKAIELQPARASFYLDRGVLLARSRNFAEAKWDLEEALSLSEDPKLPRVIETAEQWLEFIEREAPDTESREPGSSPNP